MQWREVLALAQPMAIQPIFIFSVSRSGSTLLQRIIAAHPGVATVSEPWLLLPYAYALRREGVDAEYSHPKMVDAIEDFCQELPGKREDYRRELREWVLRLYEQAAAGQQARYFLDKSPPYCLIAREIIELFPGAKFVFLWRNPLSVAASVIETWEPWRPTLFPGDLFTGLPRLIAARAEVGPRAHSVRFEDIVGGEERSLRGLMEYLEIEFDPEALSSFSKVELNGRTGDPTGVKRYSALSSEPRQKWKQTLANPLRRDWARRYLNVLGAERLSAMGYDAGELLRELGEQPLSARGLLPDIGRLLADVAKEPVRVHTRNRRLHSPNVIRKLIAAGSSPAAQAAPEPR
jgi:Sulfotransferase family